MEKRGPNRFLPKVNTLAKHILSMGTAFSNFLKSIKNSLLLSESHIEKCNGNYTILGSELRENGVDDN